MVPPQGAYKWSPRLEQAGQTITFWKSRLSRVRIPVPPPPFELSIKARLSINDDNTNDIAIIRTHISNAWKNLREIQKNSVVIRDQHLLDLASKYADKCGWTEENAVNQIRTWEAARRMAKKLRWYIKTNSKNGVNTLLIPEIDENGVTTWKTISDKDEIFHLLIQRNTEKLSMSNKSPFATGPIADAIGPYGDNDIVDKLLNGTLTPESLGIDPNDIDIELNTLLQALQYATTPTGKKIPQIESMISLDEYKQLFRKTGEMTASSPSKTHMGHYIASCERDSIAMVHLLMMNIPFQYGFPLDRWLHSLHCMLLKKDRPYINKLRIIQLIEADFNASMKILLSRRLMRHADNAGVNSTQTHGGRQGRSTYDAMIISQLTTDIRRLNKSNLLVTFNDADGCYNRVRPELCSIVL